MQDTSKPNQSEPRQELQEGVDYYFQDGLMVFTEAFHLKRGECCGNKCLHCPFPRFVPRSK